MGAWNKGISCNITSFWFSSSQYKSVALACSPHSKFGGQHRASANCEQRIGLRRLKTSVTTAGHEKFLSQAAMALTVVIAFIAVLITSVIVVFAL
jgi:hypothetical protein